MRILLTGFEPFGSSDINSSWETAYHIGQLAISGVEMKVVQLPVSFISSGKLIRKLLQTHKPDALVMLGQRGKGQNIDIERIAVNMMDSVNPDNDGFCPHELPIIENECNAYFSNVSVKTLKDALENANIPSKVSNDILSEGSKHIPDSSKVSNSSLCNTSSIFFICPFFSSFVS